MKHLLTSVFLLSFVIGGTAFGAIDENHLPIPPKNHRQLADQKPLGSQVSQEKYNELYADPSEDVAVAGGGGSSSLSYRDSDSEPNVSRVSITPMAGGAFYWGRWGQNIYNKYTMGLAVEIPVHRLFSLEAEGGFGQYTINYAGPYPYGQLPHIFNQYSAGLNGKVYFIRHSIFNPYAGLGLVSVYYENLRRGPFFYNQWIGSAQAMLGTDINVTRGIAIGARGEWIIPMLNLPYAANNGYRSFPGSEDAAAVDTSYFRILGTVKVSF